MGMLPTGSQKSSCASRRADARGRLSLQLGAGVRIDFAVQANFFKSRCCPSHDSPSGPPMDRECELRIPELLPQINAPAQIKPANPLAALGITGIGYLSARFC